MHTTLPDILTGEVKQIPPVEKEFAQEAGLIAVRFAKDDPEDPQQGWARSRRYRGAFAVLTAVSALPEGRA